MKINETNLKQLIDSASKAKPSQGEESTRNNFKEIFDQAVSAPGNEAKGAHKTAAPLDSTGFIPIQNSAINVGEEAVTLLENFAHSILRGKENSALLDTFADTMEHKAEELKIVRDGLDISDPLRENIDVIGSLTVVEAAKIRRGYYS